jgi:hypothetical protein
VKDLNAQNKTNQNDKIYTPPSGLIDNKDQSKMNYYTDKHEFPNSIKFNLGLLARGNVALFYERSFFKNSFSLAIGGGFSDYYDIFNLITLKFKDERTDNIIRPSTSVQNSKKLGLTSSPFFSAYIRKNEIFGSENGYLELGYRRDDRNRRMTQQSFSSHHLINNTENFNYTFNNVYIAIGGNYISEGEKLIVVSDIYFGIIYKHFTYDKFDTFEITQNYDRTRYMYKTDERLSYDSFGMILGYTLGIGFK